jgi:hypothetical protein
MHYPKLKHRLKKCSVRGEDLLVIALKDAILSFLSIHFSVLCREYVASNILVAPLNSVADHSNSSNTITS